ncbi:NAD+ synthase [Thioalkalivibrio sp. XN279]|uniref:NAD+ synthase n=1 Tax=Thioalkalivibrio sp. XN279 TaxID=2714953 RepID=UPI00140D20FF|nr:NAD+ synthase [Thioalkalivibrio sp. XN279]NHA16034.1 NAD+ synthase [Thioalkalivibrio sp. XN279]
MRIAIAQFNPVVGDVEANVTHMLEMCRRAHDALRADLVVFPELALCGYPPEDLLFHRGFARDVAEALQRLKQSLNGMSVLVGYPEYDGETIHNSAILLRPGDAPVIYRKQQLPNYGVFDEKRYFQPGTECCVVEMGGVKLGITICEDLWSPGVAQATAQAGAEVLISINGSPYDTGKLSRREAVMRDRIAETGLPVIYANLVGGQDELVFDGGSMAFSADGELVYRAPFYVEALELVEVEAGGHIKPSHVTPAPEFVDGVYRALELGVADYVNKHRFPGVVLGLSGGVDSALTLAIAVDALGPERVRAVMMPSRYTTDMSQEDAAAQARALGVQYDVVSIEPIFEGARAALAEVFAGMPEDVTEENIQARCRGMILMAMSNKFGCMLLTTGNKSEMAVGYATLYGDMAGGFAPLKDCSKTLVYRLARHRNARHEVIPPRVLERPPSAELRPDQKDTDSLPPYEVLDPILEAFIEEDASVDQIVARGYERAVVGRILGMVKRNEYKRRQAPPGIRISRRAFGRDWRYPITSGFAAR